VMQERAETQEELRQLRADLATIDRPEAISGDPSATRDLQQSYDKLAAEAEALTLENRRLAETVSNLEARLGAQQAELTETQTKPEAEVAAAETPQADNLPPASQAKPASIKPAARDPLLTVPALSGTSTPASAAPEPAPAKPAASQSAPVNRGRATWFVNFGSYTSKSLAISWSGKLRPVAGEVIVAPGSRDGKTFYRVRVVGLTSQDSARKVAQQLEADQQVSRLWVGKE
jgi:cell division protein FtsN